MDVDVKQATKGRKSFRETLTDYSQDTTVHGVRLLASTSGLSRLVLCSIIIGAFVGLGYQCRNRILYYQTKPTNVNIDIKEGEKLALPAFAICRKGFFHARYSTKSTRPEYKDMLFKTAKQWTYKVDDLFRLGSLYGEDIAKNVSIINTDYGACVSVNNDAQNVFEVTESGFEGGIKLFLDAIGEEIDSAGFMLVVYPRGGLPRVFDQGVPVGKGKVTNVAIKKVEIRGLKDSGKCGSKQLDYYKTYSREACISECEFKPIEDYCQCTPYNYAGLADIAKYPVFCAVNGDCPYSYDRTKSMGDIKYVKSIKFVVDGANGKDMYTLTLKTSSTLMTKLGIGMRTLYSFGCVGPCNQSFIAEITEPLGIDLETLLDSTKIFPDIMVVITSRLDIVYKHSPVSKNMLVVTSFEILNTSPLPLKYGDIYQDIYDGNIKGVYIFETQFTQINDKVQELTNIEPIKVGQVKYQGVPNIDCLSKVGGRHYQGMLNRSYNGYRCKRWKDVNVSRLTISENEQYQTLDGNYCRNPPWSNAEKPWCFLEDDLDVKLRGANWDYCYLSLCQDKSVDRKLEQCKSSSSCPTSCDRVEFSITTSESEVSTDLVAEIDASSTFVKNEMLLNRTYHYNALNDQTFMNSVRGVLAYIPNFLKFIFRSVNFAEDTSFDLQMKYFKSLKHAIIKNNSTSLDNTEAFVMKLDSAVDLLEKLQDLRKWGNVLQSFEQHLQYFGYRFGADIRSTVEDIKKKSLAAVELLFPFQWEKKKDLLMKNIDSLEIFMEKIFEQVSGLDGKFCKSLDEQSKLFSKEMNISAMPVIQPFEEVTSMNCRIATENGENFQGTIGISKSGYVCEKWVNQNLVLPDEFGNETIVNASNFCRNPNGRSSQPFCLMKYFPGTSEKCDNIPLCNIYGNGISLANTSTTYSGRVEINEEDKLYMVDGRYFYNFHANLACKQLGFDKGAPTSGFGDGKTKNSYVLWCKSPNPRRIQDCKYYITGSTSHGGVTCEGGRGLCGAISRIRSTTNPMKSYKEAITFHVYIFNYYTVQPAKKALKDPESYIRKKLFVIRANFGSLSYDIFEFQYAYSWFGLLCDIGGTAGLFVGASVLTFIETFYFFILANDSWLMTNTMCRNKRRIGRRKLLTIIGILLLLIGSVVGIIVIYNHFRTRTNEKVITATADLEYRKVYKAPNSNMSLLASIKDFSKFRYSKAVIAIGLNDTIYSYSRTTRSGIFKMNYLNVNFKDGRHSGIQLQMKTFPAYITASKDRIFFPSLLTNRVLILDTMYNEIKFFALAGQGSAKPASITVSPNGTLLILKAGINPKVLEYSEDGNFIRTYGTVILRRPQSIIWHSYSNQLIVSESDRLVMGNKTDIQHPNMKKLGQLAQDVHGNVYVTDESANVVHIFDADLNYVSNFGGTVLTAPNSVQVMADGRIVVGDANMIHIFS